MHMEAGPCSIRVLRLEISWPNYRTLPLATSATAVFLCEPIIDFSSNL